MDNHAIGNASVPIHDYDNEVQIDAFSLEKCELIFQDKATGSRWERLELHILLGQLRKKMCWWLDRLTRLLLDVNLFAYFAP